MLCAEWTNDEYGVSHFDSLGGSCASSLSSSLVYQPTVKCDSAINFLPWVGDAMLDESEDECAPESIGGLGVSRDKRWQRGVGVVPIFASEISVNEKDG